MIATASESAFAGIERLVAAAQDSKDQSARLAERYAMWFVPFCALAGTA